MGKGPDIYVGKGKLKRFDGGGHVINCVIDLTELIKAAKEYGFDSNMGASAGNRKVKIGVSKMQNADQYGNTHTIKVDTWKPDNVQSNDGASRLTGDADYDDL